MRAYRSHEGEEKPLADWVRDAERVGLLQGQELTITLAATTAVQSFPHGLGRFYRGVFVVGQDVGNSLVTAVMPDRVDVLTKATERFELRQSAAVTNRIRVWVY